MELVPIICFALFLVISKIEPILAMDDEIEDGANGRSLHKKRTWTMQEELELMKIWNKYYKGGGYSNNMALLEQWNHLFSGDQARTQNSIIQKANKLLRETFSIPDPHNNGGEIKLNRAEKEKRNEAWLNLRYRAPIDPHEELQTENQNDHHQIHPSPDGDSQLLTHNTEIPRRRRRGGQRETADIAWTEEEKLNLMKIWNRTYKGRGSVNYLRNLLRYWKESSPNNQERTFRSLKEKMKELLKTGFIVPAEHNNGVPIKLDMSVKKKRDEERSEKHKKSLEIDTQKSEHANHIAHQEDHVESHPISDKSWPLSPMIYHDHYDQHYYEANISETHSYPVLNHVNHQSFHYPEFQQYDHEASSLNPQQKSLQSNYETSNLASVDSILEHLRNNPIYSPPHDYPAF